MYGVASLIATAVVLPFIGFLAVCVRFYVRLRLKPTYLGIDDWLIAFSCLLTVAQGANQIAGALIGEIGRDAEPTVAWRIAHESKIDFSALVIEKFTYSCIKLSVLFFYRRIFFIRKSFLIANNILIILIIIWGVIFLFTEAFSCGSDSSHGHPCAQQEWLALWFAITDVLGDIAVLTLPYPCIRKLQKSRRDKVGLIAIFSLGTLSLIFGIIRLGFVSKTFTVYFHPSESKTSSHRTAPYFWTTAEVSVGLIAACLPPLRPLIRRFPSPLDIYQSIRHGFASARSGRSRSSEGLSNVDNVSNIHWFSGEKMQATEGANEVDVREVA